MQYSDIDARLNSGGVVILDGGTGTELERRGVAMSPEAWCGPATIENTDMLEQVHRDYIAAGAEIITANTYASSRLMLEPAGFGDRVAEINRIAVETAQRARDRSGKDVLVAGSLSHMIPLQPGTMVADAARAPSGPEMAEAFGELAGILKEGGCDLILLEMMYHPDRMTHAFKAATDAGLPVWAGFSARHGADGGLLSFTQDRDIPFRETAAILSDFDVQAAGIMHTPSDAVAAGNAIIHEVYDGPLLAYPDSGYFKMPQWQFEEIVPETEFRSFASGWIDQGVQIVGGCCGLSPKHIAAVARLRA